MDTPEEVLDDLAILVQGYQLTLMHGPGTTKDENNQ
jgi:hypothetical protein